uniref:Ubiquitin thioesterase OTU n=1 Tax=Oryza glumipatula TaxID=40148 RepID=A0A0E0B4M2_9ORYZ
MGCGALGGQQAVAGEAKTARVAELGESYIDSDFPRCRPATADRYHIRRVHLNRPIYHARWISIRRRLIVFLLACGGGGGGAPVAVTDSAPAAAAACTGESPRGNGGLKPLPPPLSLPLRLTLPSPITSAFVSSILAGVSPRLRSLRTVRRLSLYLVARCCLKQMAIYTPTLQGGLTQGMALWKYSRSQAVGYHVKTRLVGLPPKMNIKSLRTCFASSGKQLCGRRPARDNILKLKLDEPSRQKLYSILWDSRSIGHKVGATGTGLFLSFAVPAKANAEGPVDNNTDSPQTTESSTSYAHGKKVCTDYSVTGIPGDGRCLFRSVAHGACIRSGKRPDDDLQRKMADDLRAMILNVALEATQPFLVADEFIKRRAETEWFVEGDFDAYVSRIRKPHVWGGEPELLMASHVLRMPITVYMHDKEAGGLIAIAEYGQEYGKEDPIQVLFHGFGHYDALQIPGKGGPRSRL